MLVHRPHFYFNPRSPCGERRIPALAATSCCPFQSTLPVWGATSARSPIITDSAFQSTLPVWGATWGYLDACRARRISIHAPRVGSDYCKCCPDRPGRAISIHAPRGGSDAQPGCAQAASRHFNPRSPWGERLQIKPTARRGKYFNPRSPWGERRAVFQPSRKVLIISIHAPRGGSDSTAQRFTSDFPDFNPRSPWGERHTVGSKGLALPDFNPRSPWGERPR